LLCSDISSQNSYVKTIWPDMRAHACNPSTQRLRQEYRVWGQPRLHRETLSQKKRKEETMCLCWYSLSCVRSWVPYPALKKKEKNGTC
jgi:hypothetical protein